MTGGITQKVQADVNAVVGMANILLDKFSIPEVEALKEVAGQSKCNYR